MVEALSKYRLIVGLGNPGKEYEWTRHNLGFLVVRYLARRLKAKFSSSSFTNGFFAKVSEGKRSICLLLPLTHMNHSGVAVKQTLAKQGMSPSDMLVVYDDFHLPFGQMRLRSKGSDGGHNGMGSIIYQLGNSDFVRLRLGIGSPKNKEDTVNYVLEEFSKKEKDQLEGLLEPAADCCSVWLNEGSGKAMDQFNRRKKNGD